MPPERVIRGADHWKISTSGGVCIKRLTADVWSDVSASSSGFLRKTARAFARRIAVENIVGLGDRPGHCFESTDPDTPQPPEVSATIGVNDKPCWWHWSAVPK